MGVGLRTAGIGLVLLAAAGCGQDVTAGEAAPSGASGEERAAPPPALPDLTGEQVCGLIGEPTMAEYLPAAETTDSTLRSSEELKKAQCDGSSSEGNRRRTFTLTVHSALPVHPDGTVANGVDPEKGAIEWMESMRGSATAPKDLPGVGDEAFTDFAEDPADGRTSGTAYLRVGVLSAELDHSGYERPDPDDRDTVHHLGRDALDAALAAMSAEIAANLATLSEDPAEPGSPDGDALCATLSEAVVDRYLPKPRPLASGKEREWARRPTATGTAPSRAPTRPDYATGTATPTC